ncbi:UNVERIFIED_CONTAM: hypothetical protein GTU68_034773 [Idotea baltica]|nr:hypothetical protein [Idotea baltica]
MAIEIKAPAFPESIADGEVGIWHKDEGDSVTRDELIVEIETDKVVMEVVAAEDGVISKIHAATGETIDSEQLLGILEPGAIAASKPAAIANAATDEVDEPASAGDIADKAALLGPAARKLVDEHQLDIATIAGTAVPKSATAASASPLAHSSERIEKRVPMTRMRARIAERLLEASQQTAMLTTFNEVNMAPVMALRSKYKDQFEKTHNGTRLGFMGFFVKAACEALKRFPDVNASIDGNDVVYHGYQDIGVAVSTPGGLVVPVLRDADFMSLADMEATIRDLGLRARDNKLTIDDMTGGTFTITNGGVFGSLMSTPILNPPQTGILGMHKIQDRPMAVDGEVVILPMMNLALSYDHRLIDGKNAVQFLVAIKDLIEDPARILLQL